MRVRRRDFITLLAGATIAGPPAALAQTPPKIFRLGTLAPGPAIDEKNPLGATLLKALEQRGYALGKNLSLEPRGAGSSLTSAVADSCFQFEFHSMGKPHNEQNVWTCDSDLSKRLRIGERASR
jgi:hypothetical protein